MPSSEQLSSALADRYEIMRELGRGGMATVYLARDVRHARQVAIKVLHPELAAVLGAERFLAEITTTANLQHPHILPLFDSGSADGQLFYVMPFIDGETLRAKLDRETQLPIDEAVRIARAVADALQYAHDRGVIHRDIKPENILLQGGHALVADFGIALAVQHAGGQRMTQTGLSLGTPQYMAPEQAMGDKAVDARADIYALGAVTYEMLAGEPPFTGPTAQAIIAKVLTSTATSLTALRAKVPDYVDACVLQALEKLPADRWASAREFSESLLGGRRTENVAAVRRGRTTADVARTKSRAIHAREIVAWSVAAMALAAAVVFASSQSDVPRDGKTMEFEIVLPDSLVASTRGSNSSLALSPDGSTLVFQAIGDAGEPMLYTRRLGDREVRPIRGTEGGRAPVFTPDGRDVVFSPTTNEGAPPPLRRVSLQGGSARTIAAAVSGNVPVSWVDSARFVFARDDALWMGSGEQGDIRLVSAPDASRNHIRYAFPDVLPGGTHALISIFKASLLRDSSEIGVVSLRDGSVAELGVRGGNPRYADGRLLYVSSQGTLFSVPFSADAHRVSGTPVVIAEGIRTSLGPGSAAGFTVSPNGTVAWLTGGAREENPRVPVIVTRSGTVQRLGVAPGFYAHPRVSPDGSQVVLSRRENAQEVDIWRFSLRDAVLQRVTTDKDSDRPEWMPDGARISFSRASRDSVQYVMPLSAGATRETHFKISGSIGTGDVGPAHGYGAFTVVSPLLHTDIWLVHADSLGAPRPFLDEGYSEVVPRVSPDGRFVAYETNRTGRSEVYVQSLTRRVPEVKISVNGGREPHWSRDGSEIFFRTADSMNVARVTTSADISVVSRQSLFAIHPFVSSQTRSSYDVLPGDRGFLMLLARNTDDEETPRIIVRTNALAGTPRPGQP